MSEAATMDHNATETREGRVPGEGRVPDAVREQMRAWGSRGGAARAARMTPEQRSAGAKKAARAAAKKRTAAARERRKSMKTRQIKNIVE